MVVSSTSEEGRFVGKYELTERFAVGRTCEVFLATSHGVEGFRRTVVVKRLKPEYAADEAFVEQYLEQVRLQCALSHANVVQALDLGEFDGRYFLTEEYVEGYDMAALRDMAAQGELVLSAPLGLFIVSEVAKGVEYGHRLLNPDTLDPLKLAHGDLHPRNVLIGFQGEVKITDFGVHHPIAEDELQTTEDLLRAFGYASPEVAAGEEPTQQSDLFSLGLLTVEVCAGRHPYADRTAERVRDNAIRGKVRSELLSAVPEPFRDAVATLIQADPAERLVDLSVLYDRIISHLHANFDHVGTRALAAFVEDVGDVELSTSMVYAGMLGSQNMPMGALASDPGMGSVVDRDVSALWDAEADAGPPSVDMAPLALPQAAFDALAPSGREGEVRTILEQAARVRSAPARVVFVSGPRGIGKSHLLRVASAALASEGHLSLLLTPDSEAASRPYGTSLDLLALATTGTPLLWIPDPGAALVESLEAAQIGTPEARQIAHQLVHLGGHAPRELVSIRRAVGGLLEGLVEATTASPLVVLIDCAERADIMSLEMLHAVLTTGRPDNVLFVIATPNRGLLSQLMRAAPEDRRVSIALQPLGAGAAQSLAERVAGDSVDPDLIEEEGRSPHSLIEMSLALRFGRSAGRAGRLDWLFRALEPLPGSLLTGLSVADTPLPTRVLAEICGVDPTAAAECCERLASLNLVSEHPADVWSLGLRSVHKAASRVVERRRRSLLARRLADTIGQGVRAGTSLARPARARLLAQSGYRTEALELGRAHTEAVVREGFIDVALAHLDQLAALSDRDGMGAPGEALRLRLHQVQLALVAFRLERGREVLAHLSPYAQDLRDEEGILKVLAQQARLALRGADYAVAQSTLNRLSSSVDGLSPPAGLAVACLAMAEWREITGDLAQAERLFGRALRALLAARPSSPLLADLYLRYAHLMLRRAQPRQASQLLAEMGPALRPDNEVARLRCSGYAALLASDYARSSEQLGEAYSVAHRSGRTAACLDIAPEWVEALILSGALQSAQEKLSELLALSNRLQGKTAKTRLQRLTRVLGVALRPDDPAPQLRALDEELELADSAEHRSDALDAAWCLWRAEQLAGVDEGAAAKALAIAEQVGDLAKAEVIRRV